MANKRIYLRGCSENSRTSPNQIEAKKNNSNSSSGTNYQSIIDQLANEKSSLESQKTQLEKQVENSEQEKSFKDQLISQINEQLNQKESEIKKLKTKQQKDPGNKSPQNNPSVPSQNNSLVK